MLEQWQFDIVQKLCKLSKQANPANTEINIISLLLDELIDTREVLKGYKMASEELKRWRDNLVKSFLDNPDGWIDVNEKLPEDDLEPNDKDTLIAVDVYEKIPPTLEGYVHGAYRVYDWENKTWAWADNGMHLNYRNITHWQYRRKPPASKSKHPMPKTPPPRKERCVW